MEVRSGEKRNDISRSKTQYMSVNERETSKEKSTGRVQRVEMSVRGDLSQKDSTKSEREGLEDCSKSLYDVWFGPRH